MINVRGANVFWFEGPNWKALAVLVLAVVTLCAVARWRRSVNDRTGRPARSGLWGLPAAALVVVVGWLVLGLGATAPELDGRRVTGGITMTAAYFGRAAGARRLHVQPHRRDRAGLDPGRPQGPGRGRRRARPVPVPAHVARRAPPGHAHRRPGDRATSTST